MTLDIPGEFEPVIRHAIASGAFATPEDALAHALSLFANEQSTTNINGSRENGGSVSETHESWTERLRTFVATCKPSGHEVDDSRESIYPDRA